MRSKTSDPLLPPPQSQHMFLEEEEMIYGIASGVKVESEATVANLCLARVSDLTIYSFTRGFKINL
jgi:hypothetical protein